LNKPRTVMLSGAQAGSLLPRPQQPVGSPPPGATRMYSQQPTAHPLAEPMYWASSDLLTLASQLALGAKPPSAPDLRRHLDQLFAGMHARGRAGGIAPEDLTEASYAIMALFDEILVQANWSGRAEWQASPLQFVHFHENTAGEGFFRRAEVLVRQPHRAHVTLVYFLCLALGFQGRYAVSGPAGVAPAFEAIGAAVSRALPPTDVLSPAGAPPDAPRSLLQREAPIVRVALGFFALALVLFLILRVVLSAQVSGVVQSMHDYSTAPAKH
jgi:type IV/VI secretion system ImpK/VasF family protein